MLISSLIFLGQISNFWMNSSNFSSLNYYNSPPFNGFAYSTLVQVYFIASGALAIIGNLYLIVLFIIFSKLRQLQCNWLIIFLCTSYLLVGNWSSLILKNNSRDWNRITWSNFYVCNQQPNHLLPVLHMCSYNDTICYRISRRSSNCVNNIPG